MPTKEYSERDKARRGRNTKKWLKNNYRKLARARKARKTTKLPDIPDQCPKCLNTIKVYNCWDDEGNHTGFSCMKCRLKR